MGSRQDMIGVDEGASTHIHTLLRVLLQDGHMPGVFTKLGVTIHIHRVLDATVDTWKHGIHLV